jgi:penicillin-binding protein-related factor A (putative recombinase)
VTPPWPSSRQAIGRKAQSAGKAWEKKLDTLHLLLRPYGVAVSRCHPQVRVARDAGAVIGATLIGEGPPDYIATVNGCSVVFDAKHTNKTSWSLAELDHHQAADLDRHQAAGAICFIALEFGYRGYVLPWQNLGPLWWAWRNTPGRAPSGTASLSATQIGRVGVAIPFDLTLGWYPPVLTLIAGTVPHKDPS